MIDLGENLTSDGTKDDTGVPEFVTTCVSFKITNQQCTYTNIFPSVYYHWGDCRLTKPNLTL